MRFVVVQDYKENRRKCTLSPLEGRPGFTFMRLGHPARSLPKVEIGSGVMLVVGAPPLVRDDAPLLADGSLFIVDSTWARTSRVLDRISVREGASLHVRSLPPGFTTAYPRVSKVHRDPPEGLASVEALFAAAAVLGEPRPDLLEGYHWAREFLERNAELLRGLEAPART
jgi:pre-rRNA-processing protein TSR3